MSGPKDSNDNLSEKGDTFNDHEQLMFQNNLRRTDSEKEQMSEPVRRSQKWTNEPGYKNSRADAPPWYGSVLPEDTGTPGSRKSSSLNRPRSPRYRAPKRAYTFNAYLESSQTPQGPPLTFNSLPVVVPMQPPPIVAAGTAHPADPVPADTPIDPAETLTAKQIESLFTTFGKIATEMYVLLDGKLQLIVDEKFDLTDALSDYPATFGGLEVNFIPSANKPIPTASGSKKSVSTKATNTDEFGGESSRSSMSSVSKASGWFKKRIGGNHHGSSAAASTASTSSIDLEATVRPPPKKPTNVVAASSSGPLVEPHEPIKLRAGQLVKVKVWPKGEEGNMAAEPAVVRCRIGVQVEYALREGGPKERFLTINTHAIVDAWKRAHPDKEKATLFGRKIQPVPVPKASLKGIQVFDDVTDQPIGSVVKIFDKDPQKFPRGYKVDLALIRPLSRDMCEDMFCKAGGWFKETISFDMPLRIEIPDDEARAIPDFDPENAQAYPKHWARVPKEADELEASEKYRNLDAIKDEDKKKGIKKRIEAQCVGQALLNWYVDQQLLERSETDIKHLSSLLQQGYAYRITGLNPREYGALSGAPVIALDKETRSPKGIIGFQSFFHNVASASRGGGLVYQLGSSNLVETRQKDFTSEEEEKSLVAGGHTAFLVALKPDDEFVRCAAIVG